MAACGELSQNISANLNNPPGNTAVVLGANDLDSNGTLSVVSLADPFEATLNVQTTHSDAVVRSFANLLYVVNRYGSDSIQVVDPAGFGVTQNFSTGIGTNPQQIIVTAADKGYVTLYQPDDNGSPELTVDDLLIVDPSAGTITGAIDLTPYTADDGDRQARASAMVAVGSQLFIAIQDLPIGFFDWPPTAVPDQPGKIVIINLEDDSVADVVTLQGRNPVSMTYDDENNQILVVDVDGYDTTTDAGGIEAVDVETLAGRGLTVTDDALAGSGGEIESFGGSAFVTIGFFDENFNYLTKVVSFSADPDGTPAPTEVYRSGGYIQDIAVSESGLLLIGDRDPAVNGILFFDAATGAAVGGPVNTGPAPSSITFVDL